MSKYSGDPGYYAFRILQFVFVVLPILAGLDKFFNYMTDWSQYLSPFSLQYIGGHKATHPLFMGFVGVVEILVGIGVAFKPRVVAYVVFLWLFLIVINLIMGWRYYDIALRDFGLMLSAFALGQLGTKYNFN